MSRRAWRFLLYLTLALTVAAVAFHAAALGTGRWQPWSGLVAGGMVGVAYLVARATRRRR